MYTATIICTTRDVLTISPKVLLLDIKDEQGNLFRDHCWGSITDTIKPFIPHHNQVKLRISFTADTKAYKTYENKPEQQTLVSIDNISILKVIKPIKKRNNHDKSKRTKTKKSSRKLRY